MSDKPTLLRQDFAGQATGEWTVEGKAIWNDCKPVGIATSSQEAHQIAAAHNAAVATTWKDATATDLFNRAEIARLQRELAAEREAWDKQFTATMTMLGETKQQLAAERERVTREIFDKYCDDPTEGAMRAKEKEIQQLRSQLAAEREINAKGVNLATQMQRELDAYAEQLADERDKHIVTEGLLIEANKELSEQLAAERQAHDQRAIHWQDETLRIREQVQTLVDALTRYCDWHLERGVRQLDEEVYVQACNAIHAALAKVEKGK